MKTHNLSNREAVSKLKSMVESIGTAMLLTRLDNLPISANPMNIRKVDDDGTLWFLSELQSEHNLNIQLDDRVQLIFNDPVEKQFLSIFGKAFIIDRVAMLKEIYTNEDDNWFTGYEDPNLTALKIHPIQAFYWDRSQNKILSLLEGTAETVKREKKQKDIKGKIVM